MHKWRQKIDTHVMVYEAAKAEKWTKIKIDNMLCIKGESNPRRVDGNDPGYHYPINALIGGLSSHLR